VKDDAATGVVIPNPNAYTTCSAIAYVGASPGLIALGEVCRLSRQGAAAKGLPAKRCLLALGGWTDWTAIGTTANAQKLAKLIAKAVLYGFIDGIDLDFEHLTPFNDLYGTEYQNFAALITSIRAEFNLITDAVWYDTANKRIQWLQCTALALGTMAGSYYATNIQYMRDILANPKPYFEITWTTRFNAWVPVSSPFNYLSASSPKPTG
jgi:hypothetical protein